MFVFVHVCVCAGVLQRTVETNRHPLCYFLCESAAAFLLRSGYREEGGVENSQREGGTEREIFGL